MNVDCFLKRFSDVLFTNSNDGVFETLKVLIGGTTSHRIGKLLNFSVSQMSEHECYVEVGVLTGATLCSAAYANNALMYGIDPYGEGLKESSPIDAESVKAHCMANLKGMAPTSRLIVKDFRDVEAKEIEKPIGVCFIDGKHTFEDVYENFKWVEPKLADDAFVILDDINFTGVDDAIKKWTHENQHTFDMICYVKPFFSSPSYSWSISDRFLNNGVCILRYRRGGIR